MQIVNGRLSNKSESMNYLNQRIKALETSGSQIEGSGMDKLSQFAYNFGPYRPAN